MRRGTNKTSELVDCKCLRPGLLLKLGTGSSQTETRLMTSSFKMPRLSGDVFFDFSVGIEPLFPKSKWTFTDVDVYALLVQ